MGLYGEIFGPEAEAQMQMDTRSKRAIMADVVSIIGAARWNGRNFKLGLREQIIDLADKTPGLTKSQQTRLYGLASEASCLEESR